VVLEVERWFRSNSGGLTCSIGTEWCAIPVAIIHTGTTLTRAKDITVSRLRKITPSIWKLGEGVISLLVNLFHSQATFDLGTVYAIVARQTYIATMNPLISGACKLGVHTVVIII